jgi:hypothetical protein
MKKSEYIEKLAHIIDGAIEIPVVGTPYVDVNKVVKEMEKQKLLEPPPYEPFPGSDHLVTFRSWEKEDA